MTNLFYKQIFFILLRLCLFKKLGNERISDILVKVKKVAAGNTELLPGVYGEIFIIKPTRCTNFSYLFLE